MTKLLVPGAPGFHFQRDTVVDLCKVTTDDHDGGLVAETIESWDDRLSQRLMVPTAILSRGQKPDKRGRAFGLRRFDPVEPNPRNRFVGGSGGIAYIDRLGQRRVIFPNLGADVPIASGGSLASGKFDATWAANLGLGDGSGTGTPVPLFLMHALHLTNYCGMYTASVAGGTVNFDDTLAHSSYNGSGSPFLSNEVTDTYSSPAYVADGSGNALTMYDPQFGGANPAGTIVINAHPITWNPSSIASSSAALLYDHAMSPKYAFFFIGFGTPYTTSSGSFQINWASTGIAAWA